jgi:alpha-N-acetylglucosaminidase
VDRIGHHGTGIFYQTSAVVNASILFRRAAKSNPSLLSHAAYTNDFIDITRQVLVNAFIPQYLRLIDLWNLTSASSADIDNCSSLMISLMHDLDHLLSYDDNFTLDKWVSSAIKWAGNDTSYAAYLKYNALNQVTLWGPDVNLSINDYASKQWAGLISSYYIPRWQIFIRFLKDNPASQGFNYSALSSILGDFEIGWQTISITPSLLSNQTLLETIDILQQKWIESIL